MKSKSFLIIVIVSSVTALLGFVAYYAMEQSFGLVDILQFAIVLILIIFAISLGIRRLKSEKKGQPPEDELSKKILQKAASTAFYISLYMWLVISYFSETRTLESHSWIGLGIMCMAVLFALSWVYYNYIGIKND